MKRALVLAIVCALGLGVSAFAGMTAGFGLGWYEDYLQFAPGVGLQSHGDFGIECAAYIAQFDVTAGEEWEVDCLSFITMAVTARIPGARDGPQWRGFVGMGIPADVFVNEDGPVLMGANPGTIIGLACESTFGYGIKMSAYVNEWRLGLGIAAYVDLTNLFAQSDDDATGE